MKCIMSRLLEICHAHPARGAFAPPFAVGGLLDRLDGELNACGQVVGAALVKPLDLHFGVCGKLRKVHPAVVCSGTLPDIDSRLHDIVARSGCGRCGSRAGRQSLSSREVRFGVNISTVDTDIKMQVISARVARQAHVPYNLPCLDVIAVIDRYRAFTEVLEAEHNTVAAVELDVIAHTVEPRVRGLPREIVSAGYNTPCKRADDIIGVVGGVALHVYALVPVAYSVPCGIGVDTPSEIRIDIVIAPLEQRVLTVKYAVCCHDYSSPFSMIFAILPFLSISDKMLRASSTSAEKRLNVIKVESFGKRAIN